MSDEYTAQRLHTWAALLLNEGSTLGDSLMCYATAWLRDMDKLARAEAEIAALRDELQQRRATPVTQNP